LKTKVTSKYEQAVRLTHCKWTKP